MEYKAIMEYNITIRRILANLGIKLGGKYISIWIVILGCNIWNSFLL
jgi:hypothetical protein